MTNYKYRGEGNSSLVLTREKEHTVYRLMKFSCVTKTDDADSKAELKLALWKLQSQIAFLNNIMMPLIGFEFTVPMKLVELQTEVFDTISPQLVLQRPEYRQLKQVNPAFLFAIEMPDVCNIQLPEGSDDSVTFSAEIKPKWGYLPTSVSETDAYTDSVKRSVCRFCMHQFLKVAEGKWHQRSKYCPIDLFSGCPMRMKFALKQLMQMPQNNIKLFKDGCVIWNETVQSDLVEQLAPVFVPSAPSCHQPANESQLPAVLDSFLDLIVSCLLHDRSSDSVGLSAETKTVQSPQFCTASLVSVDHHCSPSCPTLSPTCVLGRILTAQCMCDADMKTVHDMYCRLQAAFQQNGMRKQSGLDGPYDRDWLDGNAPADKLLSDNLLKVKEFLVARSAKDCSIIISLRHLRNCDSSSDFELSSGRIFTIKDGLDQQFVCNVSVIDLDPKSFDKIPFYLEEDRSVLDFYVKNANVQTITR